MRRFAATADKYQAKAQIKEGGPTFGRKAVQVKAERAPVQTVGKAAPVFSHAGQAKALSIRDQMLRLEANAFAAKSLTWDPDLKDAWAKKAGNMDKLVAFAHPGGVAPGMFKLNFEPPQAPFGPEPPPPDYRVCAETYDTWRYLATCKLPPTDDISILAMRDARCGYVQSSELMRRAYESAYRSRRIRRHSATVKALHAVVAAKFKLLGKGVSRTTYALSKHTVLKVPNVASSDNFGANFNEIRLWRKYRRRGVIKLAACRLVMILGVPCLVMQRVSLPNAHVARGTTRSREAPVWAGRLDLYQCALTSRGEWVAYDYGYQMEDDITRPWTNRELAAIERRSVQACPAPAQELGC
jgi:hypothetical protein